MRVISCLLVASFVSAQIGGPYDLKVSRIGECSKVGTHQVIININSTTVGKATQWLKGFVRLPFGWSDRLKVIFRTDIVQKNCETVNVLTKDLGGVCSAVKSFAPEIGSQAFEALAHTPTKKCVGPGDYTINYNITFSLTGIPVYFYGRYRLEFDLFLADSNAKVGCLFADAEFVPKKSGKKRKGK